MVWWMFYHSRTMRSTLIFFVSAFHSWKRSPKAFSWFYKAETEFQELELICPRSNKKRNRAPAICKESRGWNPWFLYSKFNVLSIKPNLKVSLSKEGTRPERATHKGIFLMTPSLLLCFRKRWFSNDIFLPGKLGSLGKFLIYSFILQMRKLCRQQLQSWHLNP